MHEAEKLNLQQIAAFLNASQTIRFEGQTQTQVYRWIEQVLCQQQYQLGRGARGLVRRYLEKMTGRGRAEVTRLIARYKRRGKIEVLVYRRHRFPQRYTRADVELLARVDEAHETLSGPATRRILEREYPPKVHLIERHGFAAMRRVEERSLSSILRSKLLTTLINNDISRRVNASARARIHGMGQRTLSERGPTARRGKRPSATENVRCQ